MQYTCAGECPATLDRETRIVGQTSQKEGENAEKFRGSANRCQMCLITSQEKLRCVSSNIHPAAEFLYTK